MLLQFRDTCGIYSRPLLLVTYQVTLQDRQAVYEQTEVELGRHWLTFSAGNEVLYELGQVLDDDGLVALDQRVAQVLQSLGKQMETYIGSS